MDSSVRRTPDAEASASPRPAWRLHTATAVLASWVAVSSCAHGSPENAAAAESARAAAASAPSPAISVAPAPASVGTPPSGASSVAAAASAGQPSPAPGASGSAYGACPEGMVAIPAGTFWMGAPYAYSKSSSEWKHKVAVRSYCLDLIEVTARTFAECVSAGRCTAARKGFSCTSGRDEKLDHPINCVDWFQADAACKSFGKRLPTEQEWEYAARGGAEQRTYSWGEAEPEGHACYDHPGTCKIKSYAPGAFGLYDMMGGVWEWTASPFAEFEGWQLPDTWRVYRGGSFSRRFPKWMKGWVRNRYRPKEYGGHLGFRCAADLTGSACPEGSHDGADGACIIDGDIASTAPQPPPGTPRLPAAPASSDANPDEAKAPKPATVYRDPQFDADCSQYKPGRPICHNVKGGSFADRERIRRQMGCANRDVGLDFNSICCPGPKPRDPDAGIPPD